ncbi:hypothetical protein D3C71_1458170 [compost metagenome]
MRGQRAGDDDVARAALDHVGQHVVHVLHHHVDVQVEHAVDGVGVGIHQVAAHIQPGVGVEDVELSRNGQRARKQARTLLCVQQIQHQRRRLGADGSASLVQRFFIAVDKYHVRSSVGHGLCTGKPDARCSAGDGGHLAVQFPACGHGGHAAAPATTRPAGSNQWACDASMSRLTASPARRPVRSFWRATNCAPLGVLT